MSWYFCVLNLSEIVRKYTVDKNLKYINCTAQLGSYVMTLFFFFRMSTWANRSLCIVSYAIRNYNTTRTLCSLVATKFDFFFQNISFAFRKVCAAISVDLIENCFFDCKINDLQMQMQYFFPLPLNKLYELKLAHICVISKRPTDWIRKIELSWYSY